MISVYISQIYLIWLLLMPSNTSGHVRLFKGFNLFLRKLKIDRLNHILDPLHRTQPHNWRGNNYT